MSWRVGDFEGGIEAIRRRNRCGWKVKCVRVFRDEWSEEHGTLFKVQIIGLVNDLEELADAMF